MPRFTELLNDCAPTGSAIDVNIINGSISVDVTVADYVSVTQSGAYITTLGSNAITNLPTSYPGSVYQATNPWVVLGSQAISNLPTSYNGSVYQSTNPWIVLGSVNVANKGYLGSTFYLSGLQDVIGSVAITNNVSVTGSVAVSNNWLKNKQYISLKAGSPGDIAGAVLPFAQVVDRVVLSTSVGSMYVSFDNTAAEGVSLYMPVATTTSLDITCGSISAYSEGGNGSLFVIGIW